MKIKFLTFAGMLLLLAACNDKENAVESVSINKSAVFLAKGDTAQLSVSLSPENADNQYVTWSSADASIATISASGIVTAVANGKTTITVTSEDGGKTATCSVTVNWMGKARPKSDEVWTVGKQQWTDAIVAPGCQKIYFDGGVFNSGVYKADCRRNEFTGMGDWFSYEAVVQYKEQICPDGWRVPTRQDFYYLDSVLYTDYHKSLNHPITAEILANIGKGRMLGDGMPAYRDTWGAEITSYCYVYPAGTLNIGYTNKYGDRIHDYSGYWSQTEKNGIDAYGLALGTPEGFVTPQYTGEKANGHSVRCVK